MQTIGIAGLALMTLLLVMIASTRPRRTKLSVFELERRRGHGDDAAREELARHMMLSDLLSLKRAIEAVFLVAITVIALGTLGYVMGIIVALGIALLYQRATRFDGIAAVADRLYEPYELPLIHFLERHPQIGSSLRSVYRSSGETVVSSKDELMHILDKSDGILTHDEKNLVKNGLQFNQKKVEDIMTPRGIVETLQRDEVVGPLVLDQLHRTGHSRFPVIDGDIDHVVGIIYIKELLSVGAKDSEVAEKVMEKRVYYINQDQTLDHALAAFIKTRHHLFIVVNGYRETAGVLSLEDVMEALLGKEIVDEFDLHDDLRAVAARSAKDNNDSPHGTTV